MSSNVGIARRGLSQPVGCLPPHASDADMGDNWPTLPATHRNPMFSSAVVRRYRSTAAHRLCLIVPAVCGLGTKARIGIHSQNSRQTVCLVENPVPTTRAPAGSARLQWTRTQKACRRSRFWHHFCIHARAGRLERVGMAANRPGHQARQPHDARRLSTIINDQNRKSGRREHGTFDGVCWSIDCPVCLLQFDPSGDQSPRKSACGQAGSARRSTLACGWIVRPRHGKLIAPKKAPSRRIWDGTVSIGLQAEAQQTPPSPSRSVIAVAVELAGCELADFRSRRVAECQAVPCGV